MYWRVIGPQKIKADSNSKIHTSVAADEGQIYHEDIWHQMSAAISILILCTDLCHVEPMPPSNYYANQVTLHEKCHVNFNCEPAKHKVTLARVEKNVNNKRLERFMWTGSMHSGQNHQKKF